MAAFLLTTWRAVAAEKLTGDNPNPCLRFGLTSETYRLKATRLHHLFEFSDGPNRKDYTFTVASTLGHRSGLYLLRNAPKLPRRYFSGVNGWTSVWHNYPLFNLRNVYLDLHLYSLRNCNQYSYNHYI